MIIFNWSARRSGGRITIHGEQRRSFGDGSSVRVAVKVTAVDAIMVEGDKLIAIDKDEVEHELVAGWQA